MSCVLEPNKRLPVFSVFLLSKFTLSKNKIKIFCKQLNKKSFILNSMLVNSFSSKKFKNHNCHFSNPRILRSQGGINTSKLPVELVSSA